MNKLFILLALFPVFTHSQQITWGEVSPEEMKMEYCDFDSSAKAMVLYDHIVYKYEADDDGIIKLFSERHIRIKVFTNDLKQVSDLTDLNLFFTSHESDEKLIKFESNTFNYNNINELEISKLNESDLYKTENIKDAISSINAAIPNIIKGSVFEFKYTLVSKYILYIPNWYFQSSYPVKYSEFEAFIPEYFQFSVLLDNTNKIDIKAEIPYTEGFLIYGKIRKITGKHLRYIKKNIPPVISEPFINSLNDYSAQLIFQVTSYKLPGGKLYKIATNWDELYNFIWDKEEYRYAISTESSIPIKLMVKNLTKNLNDSLLIINKIKEYIVSTVKWNKHYTALPLKAPWEVYNKKTGNSAEINMLFLVMLREAGFQCLPVLTATRSEGSIQSLYPFLSQFNHLVCYSIIDSVEYILDATKPLLSCNTLPEDLINQKAWVLSKPHKWIDLKGYRDSKFMSIITAALNENGDLSGKMDLQFTGYYAARYRKKILDGEELKKIFDSFIPDGSITACNSSNDSLTDLPLKVSLMFEINQYLEKQGDILTARAIPSKFIQNNPLSSETRLYPIHFEHSKDFVNIVNISLPNNFSVSELPEASSLVFPDNSGNFTFKCSAKGNAIQTIMKYKIQNEKYEAASYHVLRKLFLTAMQKQNSVLVVKKNE